LTLLLDRSAQVFEYGAANGDAGPMLAAIVSMSMDDLMLGVCRDVDSRSVTETGLSLARWRVTINYSTSSEATILCYRTEL